MKTQQKSVAYDLEQLESTRLKETKDPAEKSKLIHHQLDLKEKLGHIGADIAELENVILNRRSFKKSKFLENYKALLAKTGVKIGQIEAEAGVAPGYVSRIDKEGNTTDPSIEFIATAARLFDVSIDQLLYGNIEDLTETEQFLLNLITRLTDDTIRDAIVWEEVPNWSGEELSLIEDGTLQHPMYQHSIIDGTAYVYYFSRYGSDVLLSRKRNSYCVVLPNTHDVLYLMACEKEGEGHDFFEIYLNINDGVSPLCNTEGVCGTIKDAVDKLYEEIQQSAGRIHISDAAVEAIYKYLNGSDV